MSIEKAVEKYKEATRQHCVDLEFNSPMFGYSCVGFLTYIQAGIVAQFQLDGLKQSCRLNTLEQTLLNALADTFIPVVYEVSQTRLYVIPSLWK